MRVAVGGVGGRREPPGVVKRGSSRPCGRVLGRPAGI